MNDADARTTDTHDDTGDRPIIVLVHLARDKDVREWRKARESGTLVGINDETPYGYGRAENMGCRIRFSRSDPESKLGKFVRLAVRVIAGFDLIHGLRQKDAMLGADIIWTHTESQYLAMAFLLSVTGARCKLLGQSVWLIDRWQNLGGARRALYRWLIARVDVLTFLSTRNLSRAQTLFPDKRSVLVRFGIPTEHRVEPRLRPSAPIHVLSIGNDRDRDWETLIEAVRNLPNLSLTILSGSISPRLARGVANVTIGQARTQEDLMRNFEAATLVCVPLRANLHASGITVIEESALAGVPVVASDAGGLDAYFTRDEIRFVPSGDVPALRAALIAAARDPEDSLARARRAQSRVIESLSVEAYIGKHVELSREVLGR